MRTLSIIAALLLTLPTFSLSRTLEVCGECSYFSIRKAIEAAEPGDEVLIHPGLYREGNIVVDKPITLRGIGYPIIDGEHQSEIITVTVDGVTIDGLQIQNVGTSYTEDRAGIRIKKSDHFTISCNRLINTFFGIYLEHANDGIVSGNEVIGEAKEEMSSGNAIHLWYCKRVTVEDNHVSHHRDGIYFEFVDNSLVQGNSSEDNLRYGLHFMFSNDDTYLTNTFRRNGAGVAVMFSRRIHMTDNVFEYNWGRAAYGLLLKEIYDAEIYDNVFRENTIGIFVEGSTRLNYTDNEFIRNGWAVKMSGGCFNNTISGNNFIGNTFDLSINSKVNDNLFDGNYWNEYSGYDLDHDGTGDVPHRPVKLFNYIVNQTPEAMVLLRGLFVDLINFSEKISPVFTPAHVVDNRPAMGAFP